MVCFVDLAVLWFSSCQSQFSPFYRYPIMHTSIFSPLFCIFSWMFLNPDDFFPIWILIFIIHYNQETSRSKLKKHSVSKIVLTFTVRINCSSDHRIFANSWPQPRLSKVFLSPLEKKFSQKVRTILETKYKVADVTIWRVFLGYELKRKQSVFR